MLIRLGAVGHRRCLLVPEADSLLDVVVIRELIVVVLLRPAASYEENAEKGEKTAADKFQRLLQRSTLKITVEDGASDNHREGEQDKLDRNDLGRVEPLKRLVHISDLHDGSAQKNDKQPVCDGGGKGSPER